MSNQTNPNPSQSNAPKIDFTTQSVGVAAQKQKDLVGIILRPQEIAKAVERMLTTLGIPANSIFSIDVMQKNGALEISAKVEESEITETSVGNFSWAEYSEMADDKRIKIKQHIFNALRNKAYYGKFRYQRLKIKGEKYVTLNFDADILLAFLYDIPYNDEFYKSSPLDLFNFCESREEKDKARKLSKKLGYVPCGAILSWRSGNKGFHPQQVEEVHREDR